MRLLDRDHPMFTRAWVRWATVLVPALWAVFEAMTGSYGWAAIFATAAAYAAWELLFRR